MLSNDHIARNLTNNVSHIKERDTGGPFNVGHVKVFLHARETGVGDIDTIQVAALS